jgi:hypothetical protein
MKSTPINELSTEELGKRLQTARAAAIIMGFSVGLMVVISIVAIFTIYSKENTSFTPIAFMPLFFLPLLYLNIKKYRDLKSELNKRAE